MSGKRVTFLDSSLFTKPPPTFKLPPTVSSWSNKSNNSYKKVKRDEPLPSEKQSTHAKVVRNYNHSDIQNDKNDSTTKLSQTTPQYVLTATQSFMMVQNDPSSFPIQNLPVAVDPSYYAFYYDPKSTSGFAPAAAFSTVTPVSPYPPSMAPFALPPPLPPVPPPQNPPPPPPPSTSTYKPPYSPTPQHPITPTPPQYSSTTPKYNPATPQYSPATPQYSQATPQYSPATPQYSQTTPQYSQATPQYSPATPQYSPATPQYSPATPQYSPATPQPGQFSFAKPAYYKRPSESEDYYKKNIRKRKKPLSQNIPQRKDWSVEEAKRALDVEKDCNKRNKRQSLIIKFPDLELNRLIVANLHESIDSVHFQQPSTPRFCFVTLQDSADPETVIRQLNRIPFGQGYLTAEFKKDREDDINIGPEDIDPLTLYVGNLAQDVTKEDMVKAYPKQKRIDIGYAKKMKYTRYAFVSFKSVDDSIEAFQTTHATQMYSKSLIVRFRRLHGTVGMPGEPKPPPLSPRVDVATPPPPADRPDAGASPAPWDVDVSRWVEDDGGASVGSVKEEISDDDEADAKPTLATRFMPGSAEVAFALHRPLPFVAEVKAERGDGGAGQPAAQAEAFVLPRPMVVVVKPEMEDARQPQVEAQTHQLPPTSTTNTPNPIPGPAAEATIKKEDDSKSTSDAVEFPMPIPVKEEIPNHTESDLNKFPESYIRKMFTPISVKTEPEDNKNAPSGVSDCGGNEAQASDKVGPEAVDESGGVEVGKNASQNEQFEFGDWMTVVPTVKNEPVEEDDMDDGIDSSGDEEFSFSHIMKSKLKKTERSAV